MPASYTVLFRGEIRPNVFLFDVRVISEDCCKSALVGSVVFNVESYPDGKSYVSIPAQMASYSKEIVKQCAETSKKIMNII